MNATTRARSLASLTALGLALTGFFVVGPTATAQVCLPSESDSASCGILNLACSAVMADAATAGTDAEATMETVCSADQNCITGGSYSIEVDVEQMGPRDAVYGEVVCNGTVVAACTVTWDENNPLEGVTQHKSCRDQSDPIPSNLAGAMECNKEKFDRLDGIEVKAEHWCAEPPPGLPEW